MRDTVVNANTNELNNLPLKLKTFYASRTFIRNIDLSKNINLEDIYIYADGIQNVNLSPNLRVVNGFNHGKFASINLPNQLEEINGLSNGALTSIDIPNSVTKINDFYNSDSSGDHNMDHSIPWNTNYNEDIYGYGAFAKNPLTHIRAPQRFETYFKSELFLSTIPTRATLEAPGNMEFY